jgi:hypothetical protein
LPESAPIVFIGNKRESALAIYLQSTTEENLYLCILHGIWGARTNKIANWRPGDVMITYVDRGLAALFEVAGKPYYDETPIWPNDNYPYRVAINLRKIIHPEDRYSISSPDTREVLFRHHSKAYAVKVVLNARPINQEPAELLLYHIDHAPPWTDFNTAQMLRVLEEGPVNQQQETAEEEVSYSLHTQMQFYLAQLGHSLKFQIWIPKADQGNLYRGAALGELSLSELPELPYSKRASRKVQKIVNNIDVIWLQDDNPAQLFEVEHTTSIYSGLLRMSDLVTMIPSLDIGMYVCASESRKRDVKEELTRPTFERSSVPLSKKCRFISFENLTEFMETNERWLGHMNISVLNELSEPLVPDED